MTMRFLCSLSPMLTSIVIPASLALTGCGGSGEGSDGFDYAEDFASQPSTIKAGSRMYFDEFDGNGLGANWLPTRGAFTASGGTLLENSGQRYTDAQLVWVGGTTESPDQVAKIQVVEKASHTWGFMFRTGGGHHYEVHLPVNSTRWRWELNDPDFVELIDDCSGGVAVQDGDWLAATAVGSGTDVVVSVWRWDNDPDLGGLPNPDTWGAPDCVMTGNPSVTTDERGLGIRSYTGSSTAPGRADHWAGGDVSSSECGNGILESGEDCDEGTETASCNADCTLAACGDGIFNSLAEQCEFDVNCGAGEVCNTSCLCDLPPPPAVCGNGILESGEDCDEGTETASCNADCTLAACGDGIFNPLAEQCEQNADCTVGELCLGCTCTVSNGQLFSDDFLGGSLGADWSVQAGSFSVSGGLLFEDSGTRYLDARLRWSVAADTPNQFGKLKIEQANSHSWGFQSRLDDSTGHHYEIHLPAGTSEWRWELYNPGFVDRVSQCMGDSTVADGDWIGYTIDGSGPNTTVQVWRWGFDPDGGGVADPINNWGAPDCVMQTQPSVDVAAGLGVGIRSYTAGSTQNASIDAWTAGDLVGGECGNGVVEPGEACDDGGETLDCNADCTLADCGDGIFNPFAEQCEFDVNCSVGEVCGASCACEVPPPPAVCGNGIPEAGEDCDDGGQSPSCDADCTLPVCGDGELNAGAGEDCEAAADCAAGELCVGCACAVSSGQLFSDGFGGEVLDPAWTELSGSFSVSGGSLIEGSGSPYTTTQLLWDGGLTDTPDQFAKLQLVDIGARSWGFILRFGDSSGHHYEVHVAASSGEWRWELLDPDFVGRVGSCLGDRPPTPGDWLGAAIEGAGANTKVSVWRWDADPDPGAPNPAAQWGAPDCQMELDPGVQVDDGRGMGVRSYTGNSTSSASIDNWTGGDLLEPIPDLGIATVTLILDRSGAGTPNSMIDPDGIAVDSAGNVYVAACGLSAASTGFFKITPSGNVTRLIDSTGDGIHPFDCGVGVDVDSSDNVYVVAFLSDNVFKVTPAGQVTQILDSSGAGPPNSMSGPIGVAVSDTGDVYVSAFFSDSVHKITPEGDKSLVLDSSGDGMGSSFFGPFEIDTDLFGNVFVAANESDNVFKISPAGLVSEIINASGDGTNPLSGPHGLGCDAAGNVYVTGNTSDNVFRIEPSGTITQIMDINGDGAGNLLDNPTGLKATADGKVYVTAFESDNAFEWDSGTATQILTIFGDGFAPFDNPADDTVAIGPNGELYMTGTDSDTVFRILLP